MVPDCANQQFFIAFSENVVTSTVEAGDFQFISSLGQIYPCSNVVPGQSGAQTQNTFTLEFGAGIGEGGTFTLNVTELFGNIEDACGNTVVDTTFEVEFIPPPAFEVVATTACNGSNGSIRTSLTSGTLPAEFLVDGNAMPNGYSDGLDAGVHDLTMIDASGCTVTLQATVPNHELHVSIPPEQDALSCANPLVTIEGVTISPAQEVLYSWTALLPADTITGFSTSVAPQVSDAGLYSLQVTDPVTGCTDDASVAILESTVVNLDLNTLTFPNVISPNGDGRNDIWQPFLASNPGLDVMSLFDNYQLSVFDRWGIPVQQSGDAGKRTWNASGAVEGTYFYTVSYSADCGARVEGERNGVVTVLR